MARQVSAGLMMYRIGENGLEIFLVHPGGPYFKNKDKGVWSIPKGLLEKGEEDMQDAALREFVEETGIRPQVTEFIPLGSVKQKSGKVVYAWAFEGEYNINQGIKSNFFEIECPPNSGRKAKFPEVDRAEFLPISVAKQKINPAQKALIERLQEYLKQK